MDKFAIQGAIMGKDKDVKNKGLKLTIIVLIIMGLFFLREDSLSILISKFKSFSVKDMSLEYINKIELEEGGPVNIYGERILHWNGKSLSVLSLDGSPIIKKDFQFDNPDILFGRQKAYVIDRDLGDIYVLNENGETIEKIQTHKGIFNLKEELDKLIVHSKWDDTEAIVFMDSNGEELWTNSELNDILTYSINEKASKYLVSNINLDEGMESRVNVYESGGVIESSINFPGEIVVFTQFIGSEQLVLTNLNLYLIDQGETTWEKQYPFIKGIEIVNKEIYILYDSNLEILNFQGEVQKKLVFPKEYNRILVHNDLGILYGPHDILGVKNGETVLEYEIKEEIKTLYGSGDLLGIRLNDTIDLYHLKNKR